jgi:uncharacterized protein with FMN-binding domain
MKRAPWYLVAGAVAGFAGIIGLHSPPAAPVLPGAKGAGSGTGAASTGSGSSAGSSSAGSSPAAQPSATGPARTASGALEQYGYGELAVRVTVTGSRVTNVTVPTLRTAEPYSQQLAVQVIPMLKSQVLAVGSAQINGVSGATYTSEAYAMSIQAALDKLHVK